jgi:phospholipid/cholesterol/gamma-HCH transport system permease protein
VLRFLDDTGRLLKSMAVDAGYVVRLFFQTMRCLPFAPFRSRAILRQVYITGVQSLPVTMLVGVFSGMILALQTGITLQQFHIERFLGTVVLLSMCKELGPFMTAFILSGRVGSAMAAELGTMSVSEEIDALRVMSIDPVKFLVLPRFLALVIFAPIITIYANILGVIGGGIVAKYQIGVEYVAYYDNLFDTLKVSDLSLIYGGVIKSMLFGMTIALVGCSLGIRATRGAEGVGEAARKSVVYNFMLILIFNYVLSSLIERYW